MKTKFNRIAIIPRMCDSCKQFMWLEPYRKSEVFHRLQGIYTKDNICKDCIEKYDVKGAVKDEASTTV